MYFDAVVDISITLPVFNGTPDEVREWLSVCEHEPEWFVYMGRYDMFVSVWEYLYLYT